MTDAQARELAGKIARDLWEERHVPRGRNWEDHAVSAARIYWNDKALAFIESAERHGYELKRKGETDGER